MSRLSISFEGWILLTLAGSEISVSKYSDIGIRITLMDVVSRLESSTAPTGAERSDGLYLHGFFSTVCAHCIGKDYFECLRQTLLRDAAQDAQKRDECHRDPRV